MAKIKTTANNQSRHMEQPKPSYIDDVHENSYNKFENIFGNIYDTTMLSLLYMYPKEKKAYI